MKYKNFEDFLSEKCPCHTNNGPEGFDRWEEQLDIQELIDFADLYAEEVRVENSNIITREEIISREHAD